MAFWGVEVKPGKPYIHRYDDDQGRLHLSQATMGTGSSTKKSILQCSVGDKKPINLCSLVPEKLENCTLNLEFEEDEKVTFSVIGSHTIHLSGFFFGDTDNEDGDKPDRLKWHVIGSDSETGNYSDYGMEHEDEDDSIDEDDDDDFDMYSSSPVRKSGGKIQIVVKNGSGNSVLESEDEDGFPISSPGDEQDKCKDKNGLGKNLKRNISAVDPDGESLRRAGPTDPSVQIDTASPVNETKQNKKNKKKKIPDEEEMARETDSKNDVSKGANSGVLEQNVDREKEKEKKRNKKKKKLENATNAEQSTTDKSGSTTETEEKAEAKPFQVRTFPNGLVIEELTMGKPDGKKAAPGKKVSVRYIGKLKKNGKQFDANIGRAPFKFRLGVGEVIKGWDVGVNGMRVGDKRRLTIPPAMGYGARGAPGAIPPNAWLVFDVELVDVN